MAEIIISVASKVAEYLVAPVGRQLGYLFNYQCNLDELKKQIEELGIAKGSRQRDVDGANRQGEEIESTVQKWLTDTAATIESAKKFIEDEEAAKKSCFNVKSRYQRSKAAKKQTRDIVEFIQKNNKFVRVSYRLPPQRTWSTCLRGIEPFESRESTLNQIMEALKSDDINLIGVWGMGGVGKTTLASQVMKLATEDKLFDKVVMAPNISQSPDISKIQRDIAGMLGLKFEENEAELVRADRLRKSLNNHEKLLVILDDLWKILDLENIGIPYRREGCKVLLTTRNLHLLSNGMSTQKNFKVNQLSDEEAWSLFKTNAGDAVENQELRPTALQVAKKCGGLPVAIITIAKALKGESVAVWKNALDELERCAPMNIEGVWDDVYSCLALSYSYLKSDEVKRLFLLCGMLGSGDIFMDLLLQYAMCLDVFQHNLSLEQATNKLVTLVKDLKDSSLLLDTEDEHSYQSGNRFFFEPDERKSIRMHDVVRDVARSIASKDPHQFVLKESPGFEEWQMRGDELLTCTHMSLMDRSIKGLPGRLVCPKLEFFFLRDYNYRGLKIPDTFFEEMKRLKVLHLQEMNLRVLPSSFNALINLQTLCLNRCDLGDVAIIGALKKLRVLSFEGSSMGRLPEGVMQLNDLRVLDLGRCQGLRVIPRDVLSSLSRLEYLRVGESFYEWGAKRFDNDGETNACLSELTNLPNLTTLVINMENLNLLTKDMVFEKLIRYQIAVNPDWPYHDYGGGYSKVLRLVGIKSLHLVYCFSKLLKTTQFLGLEGLDDGIHSLCEFDKEGFPELKILVIKKSGGLQYVVNSMEWVASRCAFPTLESLYLSSLENLDAVWSGPIPKGSFGCLRQLRLRDCRRLKYVMLLSTTQEREFVFPPQAWATFQNLRVIKIRDCPLSTHLFPGTVAKGLENLETLDIGSCDLVEEIVADENGDIAAPLLFPKLTSLILDRLGKLKCIYRGTSSHALLQWPLLKDLQLRHCGKVEILFQGVGSEAEADINGVSAQPPLFFVRKDSFPNLEKLALAGTTKTWEGQFSNESFGKLQHLEVTDCNDISAVISPTIIPILHNVKHLRLTKCSSVKEVFQVDEQPCFSHLSGSAWILENLSSLSVSDCENLMYLLAPSMAKTTLQLEELTIENCSKERYIVSTELNVAMDDGLVMAKLETVKLRNLPNLKSFGSARYRLKCPSLKEMMVERCGAMESFCVTFSESTRLEISGLPQLTQLCKQISGLYQNLQNIGSLNVLTCKNLEYLVTPSMAKSLVQLQHLSVGDCGMMTEVVGPEGDDATYNIVFPKLRTLELANLRKLKWFCSTRNYTFSFPSLKEFSFCDCNQMEFFCEGALNTPRLVTFNLPDFEGDLNTAIKRELWKKESFGKGFQSR